MNFILILLAVLIFLIIRTLISISDDNYYHKRLVEINDYRIINRYNTKKRADMYVVQRYTISNDVLHEERWFDVCEFYTKEEAADCVEKLKRDFDNGLR